MSDVSNKDKETGTTDSWIELSNVSSLIAQLTGSTSSSGVTIDDVTNYLSNPYENIESIRNASAYLTNKHGVLKDVLRAFHSLPTLKYTLIWETKEDTERNDEDVVSVNEFLKDINVKRFLRDGLYEAGEVGTVVTCLRNGKYVQFLDMDDIVIRLQRDGEWVVEVDLEVVASIRDEVERKAKIDSLPNEVTVARLNRYQNSNDKEKDRYVEIKNCKVVSVDSKRNSPHGLPLTLGAWLPILQKEIIGQVERSVSYRMLSQILTLTADFIDKDKTKPVPKPLLQAYFNEVSKVLENKEDANSGGAQNGSGLIALPHFLKLDAVSMDTTLFKEELYNKLDNDIFMGLGVSPALIYGTSGNYASAQVNNEKFFSYIAMVLEQFEDILNGYIEDILPEGVSCRLVLDKGTALDKEITYEKYKEFYMQTGIAKPWIESIFGENTFDAILDEARHEKQLGVDQLLTPPLNAYTSSNKDKQDAQNTGSESVPEGTEKTQDNDSNSTPRPNN